MVFQLEAQFLQFPHCKFRENIVRLLHIPSILGYPSNHDDQNESANTTPNSYFMAVNKFGKIGLYHPEKFYLLHTYCLDLSVPMHPHMSNQLTLLSKSKQSFGKDSTTTPKCERTHLIVDATFSPDTLSVIFATTKSLLQWYDIGEIQKQNIGLELFPRKEFMGLYETDFPVTIPNKGHVESHRLFGLNFIPTCLEYNCCGEEKIGKLFIGDVNGGVTIISIPDPRCPMGRRKIRGKLHKIVLTDLVQSRSCHYYRAHHSPVTDIHYVPERNLLLSCSKDRKFSVFAKDITDTVDSFIVSIPKGVNTIAHSPTLKMVATGSDDYVVRIFSQFIMKMPQMELLGHRSVVLTVEFAEVDFMENPILLSYSSDSELRAWDPLTFICLQSLYLTFPIGSTIICKTPEFARKSLLIYQREKPTGAAGETESENTDENSTKRSKRRGSSSMSSGIKKCQKSKPRRAGNGTIILLYCNSYARIPIENDITPTGRLRFDFDNFIEEFEELSMEYDKKLKQKLRSVGGMSRGKSSEMDDDDIAEIIKSEMDDQFGENLEAVVGPTPKKTEKSIQISSEELAEIESRLDDYVKEILELKETMKEVGSGKLEAKLFSSSSQAPGRLASTSSPLGDDYGFAEFTTPTDLDISVQATNRYYEFKRDKVEKLPENLRRMISYGQAFNQFPLLELEPIEFSKKTLVIPERMKNVLGIDSLNSVQDLLTPKAQHYFGINRPTSHHRPSKKAGNKEKIPIQKRLQHSGPGPRPHHHVHWHLPQSKFTVVGQKMPNSGEDDDADALLDEEKQLSVVDEETDFD